MSDTPNRLEPEISDEQAFQESLLHLHRNTSWLKWSAIAVTVLEIAIIAVLSLSSSQADRGLLVGGLLALMLLSNAHVFFRQRHLELLRSRLAERMAIAVKHRMRAEKFYSLATVDPLTGLYNRRFGEERLKEEIARAERNGEPLAVLLMDLDYFKEINDQFGHAAGDLVLKQFSRRLKRAVRACDLPIRIGGDEFLVILPECGRENVDIIVSRLGSFEVRMDRQKIEVACSIGRAHYQVADTPETILQRADGILYSVKAARGGHRGRTAQARETSEISEISEILETTRETAESSEGQRSSPYSGEGVPLIPE